MCVTDLRKLIEPSREEFLFSGNERVRYDGINDYDFHARRYNAAIPRFDKQDRLNEDYPWLSPYAYCAGNPVMNTDRDGNLVKPKGKLAMSIILNTLPEDSRKFVTVDSNGYLDLEVMNNYTGDSENFKSLKTLAESNYDIQVTTLEKTEYISNGQKGIEQFKPVEIEDDFKDTNFTSCIGNITGETGKLGVAYMPTNGGSGKADAVNPNSIHININPSLSPTGAAETFSHEGYAHALIYVISGGDRNRAIHHFEGCRETNLELIEKSISARKETIKNMIE